MKALSHAQSPRMAAAFLAGVMGLAGIVLLTAGANLGSRPTLSGEKKKFRRFWGCLRARRPRALRRAFCARFWYHSMSLCRTFCRRFRATSSRTPTV